MTKDLKETRELFDAIMLTQASSGGASGGSADMLQQIVEDISGKLPANYDLEAVQALFPVTYLESMNTVLAQELIRFNRLISIVRSSLNSLKKAIKGLVVMDAELETLASALTLGARPGLWMKRSYPSLKPLGSYVSDMLRRLAFFQKWIDDVKAPPTFWVSGFFFTQAFLTGSMQNYARRNSVAIDSIEFQFSVLPTDPTEAPENGVYVYGLFLEGARFSSNPDPDPDPDPNPNPSPSPNPTPNPNQLELSAAEEEPDVQGAAALALALLSLEREACEVLLQG